jgi:hypothetical protein
MFRALVLVGHGWSFVNSSAARRLFLGRRELGFKGYPSP